MKRRQLFPAAIALALVSASLFLPASAADFFPIMSVTSDRADTDFFPSERLIEGPGVGFDAAEPHERTSTLTWVTNAPNGGAGDFFNPPVEPAARLVFDLGKDVTLSEISFWGYADTNANGANDFNVRFATEAEGNTGFGTSITYNPIFTPTQPVTPRQSFPFTQTVIARYVELTPTDNFFGINPPGGDRVGIGEIAFEKAVVTEGPDISVPAEIVLDLEPDDITEFNVTVTNAGDEELVISSITKSGSNEAAFSITASPATVGAVSTEQISLEFDPTGVGGSVAATLTINSNDPDMPAAEILLTGLLPELGPDISVPSEVMLSGTGIAEALTISVANIGGSQLDLSGATLSGPNSSAFSVTTLPASIAAQSAADVVVAFDPTGIATGPVSASLQITSNDPDSAMVDIAISGGIPETFYTVSSITSATAAADFFSAQNLIEGVDVGFASTWPHERTSALTWVTNAPNGGTGDYFAPLPEPSPSMVFDLGQDVGLKEISFWGYADTNANGANLFSLRFATASDGPAGFGTSIGYSPMFAPVQDMTLRQSFEFDQGVFARYVEWVPLDNFFGINPPGGDRVGAGEIAFAVRSVAGNQFAVTAIALENGEVTLTFTSSIGVNYGIFRSTDLRVSPWEELDDSYPSQGESTVFVDDDLPPGATRVFYQIRPGEG